MNYSADFVGADRATGAALFPPPPSNNRNELRTLLGRGGAHCDAKGHV